jgi:hypothetical protein
VRGPIHGYVRPGHRSRFRAQGDPSTASALGARRNIHRQDRRGFASLRETWLVFVLRNSRLIIIVAATMAVNSVSDHCPSSALESRLSEAGLSGQVSSGCNLVLSFQFSGPVSVSHPWAFFGHSFPFLSWKGKNGSEAAERRLSSRLHIFCTLWFRPPSLLYTYIIWITCYIHGYNNASRFFPLNFAEITTGEAIRSTNGLGILTRPFGGGNSAGVRRWSVLVVGGGARDDQYLF